MLRIKLYALLCWLLLATSFSTLAQSGRGKARRAATAAAPASADQRWSVERINTWYRQQPWMTGADFIPSTAINQLEMWQAATFDPTTIDRELGYAESIGFNTMRVYLHSLAWKADPAGFKQRVGQYLSIADKHHIKTIFVFFDDCWNKVPQAGRQPAPQPGIHNSGWMQDPGDPMSRDSANFEGLRQYVTDVLTTFKNDPRIAVWDLYNEPGNSGKLTSSLPLLRNVFAWGRAVNPSQPLTAGVWAWDFKELKKFQFMHSDVITYHNYDDLNAHQRVVELLGMAGRPLICTEYMARTRNSRFATILPMLKKHNVGAINWGLVAGKTNTKYQWDTPLPDGSEPVEWFHEVFRNDGTPYRQDETDLIKKLNGK